MMSNLLNFLPIQVFLHFHILWFLLFITILLPWCTRCLYQVSFPKVKLRFCETLSRFVSLHSHSSAKLRSYLLYVMFNETSPTQLYKKCAKECCLFKAFFVIKVKQIISNLTSIQQWHYPLNKGMDKSSCRLVTWCDCGCHIMEVMGTGPLGFHGAWSETIRGMWDTKITARSMEGAMQNLKQSIKHKAKLTFASVSKYILLF